MGAKNHIKNSVLYTLGSLKLLSFMFFGSIIIVKNCSSGEGEFEERDGRQHVNSVQIAEEKMPLGEPIPEEELRYDPSLLEGVNVAIAESQINVIRDFIYFSTNPQKHFTTLQQKYEKEATEKQRKTIEALTNYLRKKALRALSKEPTLMKYLQKLREKNEDVVEFSKKLLAHRQLLLNFHESQRKTIENLSEQVTMHQEKIDELSGENELKNETIEEFSQKLKEQSEELIEKQEKIDELSKENGELRGTIAAVSQQLRGQQERIEELSRNILLQNHIVPNVPNVPEQGRAENDIVEASQTPEYFQQYMAPIAAFTLGTSVATICILGYYRFTKPI